VETKTDPKLWTIVTIAVAIIGCLGVLGSAFINVLPDILKPTSTPIVLVPTTTTIQNTDILRPTKTAQVFSPTSPAFTDKYVLVSLESIGGVQASRQTYNNIDFLVGAVVTTQSEDRLGFPDTLSINVQQTKPTVSKVYFLFQAGWGTLPANTEFGKINIVFANGQTLQEVLKIGYNIRDWSQINTPLTSPYAQQAMKGVASDGKEYVVDILTVEIPENFRQSPITKIEIYDESVSRLNSKNPAIHLWAITLE